MKHNARSLNVLINKNTSKYVKYKINQLYSSKIVFQYYYIRVLFSSPDMNHSPGWFLFCH